MRKGIKKILAFGLALGLVLVPQQGFAAADWLSVGGNPQGNAAVGTALPQGKEQSKLKWKAQVGFAKNLLIYQGKLVVITEKQLSLLDRNTGKVVKSFPIEKNNGYSNYSPLIQGSRIYISGKTGWILSYDLETGKKVWEYQASAVARNPYSGASDLHADETTLYVSNQGNVIGADKKTGASLATVDALNLSDGSLKWHFEIPGGFYGSSAQILGNFIVYGTLGDAKAKVSPKLIALNRETGEQTGSLELAGGQSSGLVRFRDRLYFTDKSGTLSVVSVNESGELNLVSAYKLPQASTCAPTIVSTKQGVVVFVGSAAKTGQFGDRGFLNILNVKQGTQAKVATKGSVQGSPLVTKAYEEEGYLDAFFTYNAEPGGLLYARYDLATGKASAEEVILPEGNEKNFNMMSPITDGEGTVYVRNDSGTLYALTSSPKPEESSGSEVSSSEQESSVSSSEESSSGSSSEQSNSESSSKQGSSSGSSSESHNKFAGNRDEEKPRGNRKTEQGSQKSHSRKTSSPKTGDIIMKVVIALIVALAALGGLLFWNRRKK